MRVACRVWAGASCLLRSPGPGSRAGSSLLFSQVKSCFLLHPKFQDSNATQLPAVGQNGGSDVATAGRGDREDRGWTLRVEGYTNECYYPKDDFAFSGYMVHKVISSTRAVRVSEDPESKNRHSLAKIVFKRYNNYF